MAGDPTVYIGTTGWGIASRYATLFPSPGTHLTRYAGILRGVEVTTSFTHGHRRATYERWADSVGPEFRFSIKLPRALTHTGPLTIPTLPIFEIFMAEVAGLGNKLGVLLAQFPPSLAFHLSDTMEYFTALRRCVSATVTIACEPRHPTWGSDDADRCLAALNVARVAADPARWGADGMPGGNRQLAYFRLHGAPRTYYSSYGIPRLEALADDVRTSLASGASAWCVFDNTAHGHALDNALGLRRLLDSDRGSRD